jgi:hypothetical protein
VIVTITGHGDDTITLKGPGLHDEIDVHGGEDVVFAFSDGTVLAFGYAPDGVWKAMIVKRGTATLTIIEAKDNSRDDLDWPDYTDQVTIGPVTWVEHHAETETDGPALSRWEV